MLQIFHTVGSLTGHFFCCACVCVWEQMKEDDYKLAKLSLSVQSLMTEGLKSSARKSDTDTLNWRMHLQADTHKVQAQCQEWNMQNLYIDSLFV